MKKKAQKSEPHKKYIAIPYEPPICYNQTRTYKRYFLIDLFNVAFELESGDPDENLRERYRI
ncbi:MAG: hypothetical protein AB1585_13800 [Thermodesulfobacteriota bacterium]